MSVAARLKALAPLLTGPNGNRSVRQKMAAISTLVMGAYGFIRIVFDLWDSVEKTQRIVAAAPAIFRWSLDLALTIPWPVPASATLIMGIVTLNLAGINFKMLYLQIMLNFAVTRQLAKRKLNQRGYQVDGTGWPSTSLRLTYAVDPSLSVWPDLKSVASKQYTNVLQAVAASKSEKEPTYANPLTIAQLAEAYQYKPITTGYLDIAKLDSLVQYDNNRIVKPSSVPKP